MAVYTKISNTELDHLLQQYNLGKAIDLKAIEEGVENSNYFLTTSQDRYVLTIYEKRVNANDLPFYLNLMQHLGENKIPCPTPIPNNQGSLISHIQNKPCAIISFLKGKNLKVINNNHLSELGKNLAQMHLASNNFNADLPNKFSLSTWHSLFADVRDGCNTIKNNLREEIEKELTSLDNQWPTNLPKGIIHADLFPDNVFFHNDKLVGIIDFYFACSDFYMFDLAICLNAWCFENNSEFNITKAKKFLSSYNTVRTISETELNALPILARGAALRFLLTRIYDHLNQVDGALVKPKDPLEYLRKLRFHDGVQSHLEYGL